MAHYRALLRWTSKSLLSATEMWQRALSMTLECFVRWKGSVDVIKQAYTENKALPKGYRLLQSVCRHRGPWDIPFLHSALTWTLS